MRSRLRALRQPGRIRSGLVSCVAAIILASYGVAAAEQVRLPDGMSPLVPLSKKDWLISSWPTGQSKVAIWNRANVRPNGNALELVLDDSGNADRPYAGGEIQSLRAASTGTWRWYARAPRMADGVIFGMFLYRADQAHDPWREYDIEFVGKDTRRVQLNVIFEDQRGGRRVRLARAPFVVDLGFDASKAPHLYEIEVEPRSAEFRVDGKVVGTFGPEDMEGEIWNPGPLHGYVDLWPVAVEQYEWAGIWRYDGKPLVATIYAMSGPKGAE